MKCAICSQDAAAFGALCEACREDLLGPTPITEQQIHGVTHPDSSAALIDVWGGVHAVNLDTMIGRHHDPGAVSILDPSVSREHARLQYTPKGWTIVDLNSENGTFLDELPAAAPLLIPPRGMIRISEFGFYFLENAQGLNGVAPFGGADTTAKILDPSVRVATQKVERLEIRRLKKASIRLQQPTGGGGGIVEVDERHVHLTTQQYELVLRLVKQMIDEPDKSLDVRGFVPLAELLALVSFDAAEPTEDHVRHLVARVRRAFRKAGIDDFIETRYGLGYRVRVLPVLR